MMRETWVGKGITFDVLTAPKEGGYVVIQIRAAYYGKELSTWEVESKTARDLAALLVAKADAIEQATS